MEYLGMFFSYIATSVVTTRLILKNEGFISLGRIFAQAGIIAVGITLFTLIFNVIRSCHVCESVKGKKKSWGISSGFSLSIFVMIFSLCVFFLLNLTSVDVSIMTTILPILTNYVELMRGFCVAVSGLIGYWFGRIFIGIC